ncbi:non-homologous end joining protein Ku [Hamadaea tsunoensis]|uniref:non-homologous end joining protein Ku n=1 Tax=Hamadaea tsunoensis TaxID=53368 RepID=UPI00047FC97E|nr:Ku protein [Hamadaea tsunoensis]
MRAIWKGSVSLGLVGIAVKLYSATEEKDIRFHQVHAADGGRISMRRVCSVDGEEVPYAEVAKGIEADDGAVVVLTDEDLAEVPVATAKTITVLEFVPAEQVDPVLFAKAYYLAPDGAAAVKPYLLLRESLRDSDRVGIVKIALRQREHLAALRVRDDVLVVSMMLWPDEVREPDFDLLGKGATLRPQERKMAASLVETMAGDFQPDEQTDDYRAALLELVEAKLHGGEVARAAPERPTKAADLLAVLTASVEQAQGRTVRTSAGEAPGRRAPAKATAGKKAAPAAKKAAAKKAPARKAPAKAAPVKKAAVKKAAVKKAAATRSAAGKTAGATAKAASKKAAPAKKAPRKKAA